MLEGLLGDDVCQRWILTLLNRREAKPHCTDDGWMDGLEDLRDNLGATAVWTGDDGIQSFLS